MDHVLWWTVTYKVLLGQNELVSELVWFSCPVQLGSVSLDYSSLTRIILLDLPTRLYYIRYSRPTHEYSIHPVIIVYDPPFSVLCGRR